MKTSTLSFNLLVPAALVIAAAFSGCHSEPSSATQFAEGMNKHADLDAWQLQRLADPATGQIPPNMRARELAFAQNLPKASQLFERAQNYTWEARGPLNFGGRTRAAVVDITDENVLLAGGISGGIFRSIDQGASWTRVSEPDQQFGVSTLVQDPRPGKEHIWYAGSGESYNSASGGGSTYIGNGMLKSTDGGITWAPIATTVTSTPQTTDPWDYIIRVAVDPSETTNDEIYACLGGEIMRSTDGGDNWTSVLDSGIAQSQYTDIVITSTGVCYAALSGNGSTRGVFRSDDGITWTKINLTGWPTSYGRIVMAIDPSNENQLYVLANTPGNGQQGIVFNGSSDWNSLWKYTYISGNGTGAGGSWENRSLNLPVGPYRFDDFVVQGGYDMLIAVKPDDPNTLIIGGTNLYRSTDAFSTPNNTTFIGGYGETTDLPDFQVYENHHPDQHQVFFLPSNPDVMFSCSDGGVHRTSNITATPVVWESLNNGYNTCQFYTVSIDHGTAGSQELMGGLQDNGTFYTNSAAPNDWTMPISYDGAFGAIADGGAMHVTSIQSGRMIKFDLDANGIRTGFRRIDPIGGAGYRFIHPFTMDPNDNDILYLPLGNRLWRQDSLSHLVVNNEWDSITTGWFRLTGTVSASLSAVAVSETPAHRVYLGTQSGGVYRIDDANTGDPAFTNLSGNLAGGGYVNCIAVDPRDADRLLVVFSNYNVHSLFYSSDGGQSFGRVGGNLEAAEAPTGAPPDFYHLSSAPSTRWASIIPIEGGNTVFMLGTSVGLFATHELHPGSDRLSDSTVWVHQASEEIGNTVVEMTQLRSLDNYLAVATHGSGIFTAYIDNTFGITGMKETPSDHFSMAVFPNPATDYSTVTFELDKTRPVHMGLYDATGKLMETIAADKLPAGPYRYSTDVSKLASGTYFISLVAGTRQQTRKLIVQ